jgi:hypothetical protein
MATAAVRTEAAQRPIAGPKTPIRPDASNARGHARRALWLLLLVLVLAQPLSIPLAYYAIARFVAVIPEFAGMDVHSQWDAYLRRPKAPDVLFIGDSQTFTDVDASAISANLSAKLGRPVSVARIGVPAEGPAFLDALTYRIMHRPSRPHLLVFELEQYTMNANRHWDPTADLWELSNPPDPGFMAFALRVDPGRWRLLRAWLIPYFITYQPISQLAQCSVVQTAQTAALLLGRVPLELRGRTVCSSGEAYLQVNRYQDDPHYRYSTQDEGYVRDAIAMARAGGSQVILSEFPFARLEATNPLAYRTFHSRARELATSLGVPMFSLVNDLSDDQSIYHDGFWLDQAHMSARGARALAPRISLPLGAILH